MHYLLRVAAALAPVLLSTAATARADEPAQATVHLMPQGTWLSHGNGGGPTTMVCMAPCGASVPPGPGYRVESQGAVTSSPFAISNDAVIEARLASSARDIGGKYLTLAGAGTALWSLAFLGFGALSDGGQTRDGLYSLSGALGVGAVALLTPGILLLVFNDSSVTVNGTRVAAGPAGLTF